MWRSTDQLLFPNHAVEGVSPETRRHSVEIRRSMALWKFGACVPTMRWAPKKGLLGKVEGPLTPGTSDRLRTGSLNWEQKKILKLWKLQLEPSG